MKAKKAYIIIYIVVFSLMLALPIVTINRVPGKVSVTEKRNLAVFPELFDSEGHVAEGAKEGFETWLGDNIGFRSAFMKLAASLKVKLLRQSSNDQVEIGRDGWYYYTPDNNIDIASGTYPNFDESVLEAICRQQKKIRDKLAAQGIGYVLILPSSKASIYPEYIASGDYTVRETPTDMLTDYLRQHSDIRVIHLKPALLEEKKSGKQLYFKTDTHWNEYGAYIGCSKIIEQLNEWGIISDGVPSVTFQDGSYLGEFSAMLGDPDILGMEECPKSTITSPSAERISSGEEYAAIETAVEDAGILNPFYYYQNSKVNASKALFFGDSMFGRWNATELLAEDFSEFTYVWDYTINQGIIDAVKPKVVFYEMAERYLNNLLLTRNISFIKESLADYQAEVLDYVIGEDTIEVAVKNTSTSAWGNEDEVCLGVFRNGMDTGIRAQIATYGGVVMPGETAVFSFEDVDAEDWLWNDTEVQMLQEGVCYFGEREHIREQN